MCKSKIEGGKRCSFHLTQGVVTGMVAYAVSLTGLSRKDTREAFEDLRAEGAHLPAPSRGEVDSYLTAEAFRVQYEPTLSEPRRTSILGRLRAAIGNVTPDGATFHAWKNVVGEAWARTRRRAAMVFLVSGLAFGAGGCATAPSQASTPAPTGTVATAPASPGVSSGGAAQGQALVRPSTPVIAAPVSVSKAATAKFGAAGVAAGYKAITDFAATNAVNPKAINVPVAEVSAADLQAPKKMMTADAAKSWDQNAATPQAEASYAINANGASMRTDVPQPAVSISNAQIDVAPNGALYVKFDLKQDLRLNGGPGGAFTKANLNRTMEYWLLPGTGKTNPWLIDGWQAKFNATAPVADVR
jgi:hypothetical protein